MAFRDPNNYDPILYFIMVSSNESGFIPSSDHEVMHLDATYRIPYVIIDTGQTASCPLFNSLNLICVTVVLKHLLLPRQTWFLWQGTMVYYRCNKQRGMFPHAVCESWNKPTNTIYYNHVEFCCGFINKNSWEIEFWHCCLDIFNVKILFFWIVICMTSVHNL